MLATLALAACGGTTAAPSGGAAPGSSGPGGAAFNDLVAKAKASNHIVTLALQSEGASVTKAQEAAFQQRFGFPVDMQEEPGHAAQEIPLKVEQAAASGKGVVDSVQASVDNLLTLNSKGLLGDVPWDAVYQGWPIAKDLRAAVPAVAGANGTFQDHCMFLSNDGWTLIYNTNNVKPDDVKNIKFDDLTTDKWKGRLAFDANALGLFVFPFAPGWDQHRLQVFAHNLGANGLKLISGGGAGVAQAVARGEGDIGMSALTTTSRSIAEGAPLDFAYADFMPSAQRVTCLTKPGVNDPSMSALFWAWWNIDGAYVEAKVTGGGAFRLDPQETDKLPLAAKVAAAGRSEKDLVQPKTEEQMHQAAENRKIAIDAMKEGIRTGQKISL